MTCEYKDQGSPYKKGRVLQTIVDRVGRNLPEFKMYSSPEASKSPYMSMQSYTENSGIFLNTSKSIFQGAIKKKQHLVGKRVGSMFSEEHDGLFVAPDRALYGDKLLNFSMKILGFKKVYHRSGEPTQSIIIRLSGSKKDLEILTEQYEGLLDIILKEYPEYHVCSEFRGQAKTYFKEYAALVFTTAKKENTPVIAYDFHGWTGVEGVKKYLSANNAHCKCACTIPSVDVSELPRIWKMGHHFLDVGKKVLSGNEGINHNASLRAILPFFLYCHAGFSAQLFKDAGLDMQFLLVLVGQSGSLKTAICKAFAEPFNSQDLLNFNSTDRAIELYREASLDMNMIVDDIFSCQDNAMKRKFEKILRAFGDGVGRAKSGPSFNEIEQISVCGACIVTAEHDLEAQQSSALRCVTVAVTRDSFDGKILEEFQKNQAEAKMAGIPSWNQLYFAAWIAYLEKNYNRVVEMLRGFEPPEFSMKFRRQLSTYKIFCALANLVLDWGKQIGVISNLEAQTTYLIWIQTIKELMVKNEDQARVCEPWQQFLQAIQQALGSGVMEIASDKAAYEGGAAKYIGYVQEHKQLKQYVLAPEKVFVAVRRWLEELGRNFVSDQKSLWRKLYEAGITDGYVNKDGRGGTRLRYLKRVTIHGRNTEMLFLDIEKMKIIINEL